MDGGASGQFDYTSLVGSGKIHLMQALPSQVSSLLTEATEAEVVEIWRNFHVIYKEQ